MIYKVRNVKSWWYAYLSLTYEEVNWRKFDVYQHFLSYVFCDFSSTLAFQSWPVLLLPKSAIRYLYFINYNQFTTESENVA